MSYHWDDNPNPSDEKLELWLDPVGSGQTILHGAYPDLDAAVPCGPAQACEEIADVAQLAIEQGLRIAPNPAHDQIHVRLALPDWTSASTMVVRDAMGRLLCKCPCGEEP